MLPKVKLFLGGTVSVMIYAKANGIKKVSIIRNATNLLSFHKSIPVFVMEDAEAVYGRDLLSSILRVAEENGYEVTYLTYAMEFPYGRDDDAESIQDVSTNNDLIEY